MPLVRLPCFNCLFTQLPPFILWHIPVRKPIKQFSRCCLVLHLIVLFCCADILFKCIKIWYQTNIFWRIFHKGSCLYHGHNLLCSSFLVSITLPRLKIGSLSLPLKLEPITWLIHVYSFLADSLSIVLVNSSQKLCFFILPSCFDISKCSIYC